MKPFGLLLLIAVLGAAALLGGDAGGCDPHYSFRLHHPSQARNAPAAPPELIERCRALEAAGALHDPAHAQAQ